MVSIMFETFQVKNCYVALQAVMSLYAAGRTTGLVCDAGDGVSHTIPVYEGYCIPHAIEKMEIAGRVLTDWMQKLLLGINESFNSSAELEIVKDIKEKVSIVASNYDQELIDCQNSSEKDMQYTLPDRRVITVPCSIRIQCPELLFKPDLHGKSCKALHVLCNASIQASDIDVRKDLCKNVILSGGTTMYEGLSERLKAEILAQLPPGNEVRIVASADRKYAVWKGASTLASLSTFEATWITKEDYQEHGAAVVHRKCN